MDTITQDHGLKELAAAVQARRWDMELTQEEVERKAGLRAGFMTYLETGRRQRLPSGPEFSRLCRALDFTPAEALELSGHVHWTPADEAYLRAALAELEKTSRRRGLRLAA